jgi:hypothetical protein
VEAVELLGIGILLVCALLLAVVVRRRILDRHGGTIDISWRDASAASHRTFSWSFGVARYDGDQLLWFKTFSLSPRPAHVVRRSALTLGPRRRPHGAELVAVVPDATIVECTHDGARIELAVPSAALPGMLAWVEAAPRVSQRREVTRASS